jgi:hypothetical protein
MARAKDLRVGCEFRIEVPVEVLSVKCDHPDWSRVRMRVRLFDTASLEFPPDNDEVEIICKPGREFSAWFPPNDDDNEPPDKNKSTALNTAAETLAE